MSIRQQPPPPKKTDIFFHSRDKQVSTSHTLSLFSCLLHLFYPLIFNFPFICPLSSLSMKFSPFHISLPCFTIRRYSLEGGGVSTGISQYLYPPLLSLNHFPGGKRRRQVWLPAKPDVFPVKERDSFFSCNPR
jgi:hypothetical protein